MRKLYRRVTRYVPGISLWLFLFALFMGGCHIGFCVSSAFADRFNTTVGAFFRSLNAHLTAWIPFSLAECVVLTLPVTVPCLFVVCMRKASRGNRYLWRTIVGLSSVIALFYGLFVLTFAAGYRAPTIDKKLGITREKVAATELYDTAVLVRDQLNSLVDQVIVVSEHGSVRPYDHAQTVEYCLAAYEKLADAYDFLPVLSAPVKQITLSSLMTYTHISGMYTYFTGEANLNTNYPDYVNVYTTAHEMAHQRGIARENEANFIAYLVCIASDDPFMQYSGYLSMYEYLVSPLYSASPELYQKLVSELDIRVRYDLQCYSQFFDKYRDNVAADVSDTVNDTYLKIQGTAEGSRSYGMVVDLAVAYHLHTNTNPEGETQNAAE